LSESDSFIQEVTEEVRQDRMFALWKKWGPFVLGAIVLLVGAAALWSWNNAQERAEAEARGAALLAADLDTPEERQALIERLEPPAQVVAEFAAAADLGRSGDTAGAAERYRRIAARDRLADHYRQLALLQAVRLEAPTADPAAALAELGPLIQSSPYSLLARELAAALHLKAGDQDAAHAELQAILSDPRATSSLRLRAQEVLTASGGEPPAEATTSTAG
jgi:hypothetical protein